MSVLCRLGRRGCAGARRSQRARPVQTRLATVAHAIIAAMAVQAAASPPPATHFITRLRVLLTVLVVTHHAAIVYGGSGSWFWRELPSSGQPASIALSLLCAVDQAFFMGFFFLLAGYFTPAALARHGALRYLAGRALRLGLPLLLFGALLGPMTVALAATARGLPFAATWLALLAQRSWEPGPLWFAQALLAMALGATAWQALRNACGAPAWPATDAPLPAARAWWWSAGAVGLAALALRQRWPVGSEWLHMQLGYFASYVFLFALGCAAAPGHWLQRLDAAQARRWRRIALRSFALLPLTGLAFGALRGAKVDYSGGLGLPAIVYAFWEPLLAWGIIAALLVGFRQRWNRPSALWQSLGGQAYAAFVLHAPVLVAVSLLLGPWAGPALLKWLAAAALASALSFALSFAFSFALGAALRGVRRVL